MKEKFKFVALHLDLYMLHQILHVFYSVEHYTQSEMFLLSL